MTEDRREKARLRAAAWYQANRERAAAAAKAWRVENAHRKSEAGKAWYAANSDKVRAGVKQWTAENQERAKVNNKAWRNANPERCNANSKAWRDANPERRRATANSYKARRRAAERGGISGPELAAWTEAQPKICFWCDVDCASDFEVDHFYPLSKGGKHEVSNLDIACPDCNRRKSASDPYVFAKMIGKELPRMAA